MGYTIGELIATLSDSGRHSDIPLVWNAYEMAKRAHGRQRRKTGDRYITHPVAVAGIVASAGGATPAICAALLHDVIEDTRVTSNQLHAEFGSGIAGLVEDLTLSVVRAGGPADPDLMLIALADRLHNLRTISPLPAASRKRASLDTLVFHVPLAHHLRAPGLARELTELACASLDALDGPDVRERRRRMTQAIRRAHPRAVAEAAAAFGGGAALLGSAPVPEWALVTGGAGALALLTAVLFGRDPKAAERLAALLQAVTNGSEPPASPPPGCGR
ncbi:HD domain-containing protein [Actinoplanes subtropicus]|uniref:HD domain-containing protein n=1 Tax=Actinoplanes subtropicus TaxID=543632 RepID=UPI0004C2CE5E|nr:HD domain-containing protein [Actinoplanes subtropicus]